MSDRSLTIDIDEIAPGLNSRNGLMRMHYHAYTALRNKWQVLVRSQVGVPALVADRVHVTITRRTRRKMDVDNLYASAKIPLDAIRKVGLIRDDDPDTVVSLTMRQELKYDGSNTTIEIEPAE